MSSATVALGVVVMVFAGGVVGVSLQHALPEKYTTGGTRDLIERVVGLLTVLTTLVLGLMIWTAYGVYSSQNAAVQSFAQRVLQEDMALADYGPDAAASRARIRAGLKRSLDQMWGDRGESEDFVSRNYRAAIENFRTGQGFLDSLQPSSDAQKTALANANQAHAAIEQIRLQMALALTNPVTYSLLAIVVAWATFLFCGFGLMSRSNAMAFAALAVGAAAVASAVYLIINLSDPYSGLFEASRAPIERILKDVGNP
jgi:hypothetical protein